MKSHRGLHILGLDVGPFIIVVVFLSLLLFLNFEHFII
jgi:hypothetical protein